MQDEKLIEFINRKTKENRRQEKEFREGYYECLDDLENLIQAENGEIKYKG